MVLEKIYCNECGKIYVNIKDKWCKSCAINNLKQNFANWTSGNKEIDELIQEMQLKIERNNIIIEWIPYNQFNNITNIGTGSFSTVYFATWKNGPLLKYDYEERKQVREPNEEVTLKCLNNSQNDINEFLNEV
jgi:hypothetical protein